MKRRHLTPSQKAAASIEIERMFAIEAKKKQHEAGIRGNVNRHNASPVKEIIPEPTKENKTNTLQINAPQQKERPVQEITLEPAKTNETKKARDKAADLVGANPRYVSDAKRIQKTHPEKLKEILMGEKTIPQAIIDLASEAIDMGQ